METPKNKLQKIYMLEHIAKVYVVADEGNTHPAQLFLQLNNNTHVKIEFRDDGAYSSPLEYEELSNELIEALLDGRRACSLILNPIINLRDVDSERTKELEELYITLWTRASRDEHYVKKEWVRLGQIIRELGILF